jgi:hypothetical protein
MPRFKKGDRRPAGAGRRRGTPNRVTADLKDMAIGALAAEGGIEYLRKVARENPAAFLAFVGKFVAKEIDAKVSASVRLEIVEEIVDADSPGVGSTKGAEE